MKWTIIIGLCFLSSCLLGGCKPEAATPVERSEGVSDRPFGIAQWEFINRDEEGKPVVKGLLTLISPLNPGVKFSGSWQSHYVGKIGEENKVGPQLNFGRLSGELSNDGQLHLELNPGTVDNNVMINAQVSGDSMKGTWEYDTFAGKTASGVFEATPAK